ncbi:MAG: hypothetical protein ONB44_11420 [candidate division KSB1 bacterium]|nr:hypothetical protein [candidate division KSB1 bacterium]MDZ7302733.1 hypothetical protein [candidate division KSB1 bacterium]MDZ7310097.1 hypothetical protein [candidate division KSB1 bacterium]
MQWQKLFVGLLVMAISASLAMAAGGGYKLAYRMKKGQSLKYMANLKADQSREMQGQETKSSSEGTTLTRLDVEEVAKNGNITFVYALESFETHVQAPGMDTTFRNPEGLLGKRTRQIISPQGKKIKSVVVDTVKLAGMLGQLGGGRQSVNLIELPEKEVKISESWTTSTTDTITQMGGKVVVTPNTTYTVAGEVDTLGYKCLRIPYAGKVTIKGEGMQMGMNFFIEGEGPTNGTVYFAPKEGLLVAMVSESNMEMTIALTGQMSMTIPQSSSTKISIVLIK